MVSAGSWTAQVFLHRLVEWASCDGVGREARVGRYAVSMAVESLIEVRPGVRSGKPCFIGTRITVYDVLDYLASGMSADQIVADFPELTRERVRAALEFAALRERRLASA